MSLTLSHGPLSTEPASETNYELSGPAHRLLFEDFSRRVRAELAGETVFDTGRGKLLHESGYLPVLYIPDDDLRDDLLTATDHSTHCPFKGDAAYWSVRVGDREAGNAVWAYPQPYEEARWLRGYRAVRFGAMDAWYDEDEQILGHLRDPYHRVDVRRTSRHVTVSVGGDTIAETDRAVVLSETGLPNRFYVPPEDVRTDLLSASDTTSVCPYKGTASYWSVRGSGGGIADVAFSYPEPLENALKAVGHLCFLHEAVTVEVDGEVAG